MSAVAARGDAAELARFRRLVTLTIVATFALILIGGIVRVSDSGLGCGAAGSGTHGWPLCEGGVLPADSAESVIEFSHRIAATVVAVLIALLAWRALPAAARAPAARPRLDRRRRPRARPGGARRAHGRERPRGRARRRPPRPGDAAARAALRAPPRRRARPPRAAGRGTSAGCGALALVTVGAGAGDDRRRRLRRRHRVRGHRRPAARRRALGLRHGWSTDQFPGCNGQGALSFGQSRLADIQLTHRAVHVPGRDRGDRARARSRCAGGRRAAPSGSRRCCSSRRSRSGRSTSGPASTPA